MANSLLIEKQTGGYFKFTLNGDTANAITSIQNDLLAVGNQLHFKTGNGANIIKEQFIYPEDVTIVSGGTFTFTTVAQVWDKLIDIDYFAWLGGGGGIGIDRFDDLVDTFKYTGNAGKTVIVDNSELRLVPVTLYNKRLFTELEDTPDSLVPNKMVVVNSAGNALILKDQPEAPETLLNSVGYFDYNDLITQTVPLNAVSNVALKLTNDSEGANTSTDQNPYGVSYVWDYTTNQFNFSELSVGDTIDVRIHLQVTTTSANQRVLLSAKLGIGSVAEFTNIIYENQFKSAGLHEINFVAPFYIGSTYISDNPAELYLTTDASATVKVDGWYVRIIRKDINIVTVDYTVPDATTLAKGIVRLAGDLGGTANNPTVPGLANKVSTSRTIGTTSPLLGGGALTSDLILSIQQANSTDSGYLSYVDWNTFNNKLSSLSGAVLTTTDQSVAGVKTFTNLAKFTNGTGLFAVEIDVTAVDALVVKDSGVTKLQIGRNGEILAVKYKVSGGSTFQFLKANGDLDSNIYYKGSVGAGYLPKSLYPASGDFTNSLIYEIGSTVGIGTTSPFSALHISRNASELLRITRGSVSDFSFDLGASNDLYIKNNGIGTTPLTILSSGNVGIGTTSPAQKLDVFGNLRISNTTPTQEFYSTGNADVWGSIYAQASGTGSGASLVFSTKRDGNSATDKMIITQAGNVGIGTTSPVSALTVGGSSGAVTTPTAITMDGTYRTGALSFDSLKFYLYKSSTETYGFGLGNLGEVTYWAGTTSTGTHAFYTSQTERLRITSGGNVGIGTTSPVDKLDVNGIFRSIVTSISSTGEIAAKILGYPTSPFGLIFRSYSSGATSIQSQREASNSELFPLLLQPLGGNVGIGTTSPGQKLVVSEGGTYGFEVALDTSNIVVLQGYNRSTSSYVQMNYDALLHRFSAGGSERMRITSGGNVLIGTTSGTGKMRIDADGSVQDILQLRTLYASTGSRLISFVNSGGSEIGSVIQNTGSTVSYNVTSDYRLKEDLKPIKGLDLVSKIKVYDYKWKYDNSRMDGVLAHELQEVVPYAVTGEKDAEQMQQVDYSKLVPILVQAIQELNEKINKLENK